MKKLTIGVESVKFYPIYETNAKNDYIGFAREVFDKFGLAKGYDITYQPHRISKIFDQYYAGKFDVKFPDNPFWDADNKANLDIKYSDGVAEFIDGTMVEPLAKGKGLDYIKKVGALKGFTPFDYLDYIEKGQVSISESTAFHGLITGMLSERVDAFYINVAIARYVLEKLDQKDTFVFDPDLPHTRTEYFASSINRPDAISDLSDYLKENKAEVDALKLKYKVNLD